MSESKKDQVTERQSKIFNIILFLGFIGVIWMIISYGINKEDEPKKDPNIDKAMNSCWSYVQLIQDTNAKVNYLNTGKIFKNSNGYWIVPLGWDTTNSFGATVNKLTKCKVDPKTFRVVDSEIKVLGFNK